MSHAGESRGLSRSTLRVALPGISAPELSLDGLRGSLIGALSAATTATRRRIVRVLRHPRTVALPTLVVVASLGAGIGVSRADAIVVAGEQVAASFVTDLNLLAGEGAGAFSWVSANGGALLSSSALSLFGPAGLAFVGASIAQPVADGGGVNSATAFGATRIAAAMVSIGSLLGAFGDAGTGQGGAAPSVALLPVLDRALVDANLQGVFPGVAGLAGAASAAVAVAAGGSTATVSAVAVSTTASTVVAQASSTAAGVVTPIAAAPQPASDFASLFTVQQEIDLRGGTSFADIRITRLDSGAWTVQIPSTQGSFIDPMAASHPNDVVADVVAMSGAQTALGRAVTAAMTEAGIGANDPVMMVGFSLGGITAAQLVSDPDFPFTVTHILTAGAPIASFDIPETVSVLSLELTQDAVPKLDGRSNPSRSTWSTLEGDAPRLQGETAAPGIAGAHNTLRYAAFARQLVAADDATVGTFTASAAPFLTGMGTSADYAVVR
ncbi:hypothetical protein [Okibacterium fritillariae]|uniref:Uncharacterized protein n=1 Tax=Okibacterium fritillariae TaxID=123320 RepID=A0A1T5K615_9MICO|nr:hypothetical protein [Okibacterium fritillariae]SKC59040.1 hypothetical protein SAMN06309945_1928 [Okibacterium fritillariae]